MSMNPSSRPAARAADALRSVLPVHVPVEVTESPYLAVIAGTPLSLQWVGEGWPSDVRRAIEAGPEADVFAARAFSEGARQILRDRGIGWVDETGAAEIAKDRLVVSRTGNPDARLRARSRGWTASVVAVAEAILVAVPAKVKDIVDATGLSNGACGDALRFLTEEGFLVGDVARGPKSSRRLENRDALLDVYAAAAVESLSDVSLELGVLWSDAVEGTIAIGNALEAHGVAWAATGAVAAHVLAPHLTHVPAADIFVDAKTVLELERIGDRIGLRPLKGGRLVVRPFPAQVSRRLAAQIDGIRIVPWPRVYADLLPRGVRGRDAAAHLWEVMRDG